MEKEYLKNVAIHGATTALVSKYVLRLDWKKSALVAIASIVTPIIVGKVRQQIAAQQVRTANTGVIQ